MMKRQQKAYFLAIISVLLWSTVSTAFKLALRELDFIQLTLIATSVATIISFIAILTNKKLSLLKQSSSKDIIKSALAAILNPFCYYLILMKSYSLLPAQVAQPLNYTWPIVLVFMSAIFLKQKLNNKSIIALFISFTGAFVIASQGSLDNFINLNNSQIIGIILALSSSIIWSAYWIFNIKDKRDETIKLFLTFAFATIYLSIAVFFISDFNINMNLSLASAVYIGFFEIGVTFILWLKALKLTDSNAKISNLIFLSPALALFFIHFILKEKIYFTTYIGLFLILISIYILNFNKKQKNISI